MAKVKDGIDPVSVESNHELYIIYTSGTTGHPTGIVRDTEGTTVALNYWMDIAYAPLIRGATTIMYEGKAVGTPDPGSYLRIIEDYKPHLIYCALSAIRAIKKRL